MFEKWKTKLELKWKEEWLKRNSDLLDSLNKEYADKQKHLEDSLTKFASEIQTKKQSLLNRVKMEEEEVEYRLKVVEDRKLDLINTDNHLKAQIKLLEAKASPTSVWTEAFSLGVSKTWDMLLPIMAGNVETLKKKIYEDATFDAVSRMNGKKK